MYTQRTNDKWLRDLASSGEVQAAAIQALHGTLFRAAAYTIERQLGHRAQFSRQEITLLAEDCAQEALLAVLNHLPEFRGESKFITWAYKFAVNIGLTMARREQWKGISLDDVDDSTYPPRLTLEADTNAADPELSAIRAELWKALRASIKNDLTEKQRLVLKWMVFDEVPMDVVVERLDTNRNAVYKILHDARLKLKRCLPVLGTDVHSSLDLFNSKG